MTPRFPGRHAQAVLMVLLLALVMVGCRGGAHNAPKAIDGTLDLRAWAFETGMVELDGQWSFVPGQLLDPEQMATARAMIKQVPGGWNEVDLGEGPIGPKGVGTYALTVLLPAEAPELSIRVRGVASAHRLWIDGEERPGAGTVALEPEQIDARMPHRIHTLPQHDSEVRIVVQVANAEHRQGGLRKPWLLGSSAAVQAEHGAWVLFDSLVFAIMLAVAVHNGVLFAVRKKGIFRLFFALFVVCLGFRISAVGDGLIMMIPLPDLPFGSLIALEYCMAWAAVGFGTEMIHRLYIEHSAAWAKWPVVVIAAVMVLVTLVTPPSFFMGALFLFQLTALIGIAITIVTVSRAALAKREGAKALLSTIGMVGLALVHDVLMVQGYVHTPFELGGPAFVGLIVVQAVLLAENFARSFTVIERLSDELYASNQDLAATNKAVERFVPFEFLEMLERRSIRDVARGDFTNLTMDVLFCDIRSFTTIAERIDPQQTFAFINEYLRYMEPPVHDHEGFIDSYQGDGILALFYGGPDQTLRAAVGMLRGLDDFNAAQDYLPGYTIRVGIGINSGELMLGTIGGLDRLDNSVVGDPVNLASRIEGMTKQYGTPLLISGSVMERLEHPEQFMIRELDRVLAKGKTTAIDLYEVMDGLPEVLRQRRWAFRETFAEGVAAYRQGDFGLAIRAFERCVEGCPEDQPARVYLGRCQTLFVTAPEEWTGLTVLTSK